MTSHTAHMRDSTSTIAFVCPFTLLKQTGTPIRANLTIQVASRFARCHVISLGGFEGERHHEIEEVWGTRRPTSRQFRVGVFTRKAARALAEIHPGIVHAFGPLGLLPALLYRRARRHPRLVLELHGLLAEEVSNHWPGGALFHRLLDRLAVRRADAIIAMSHSQREILLRRYHVAPERVTVIWSVVDLDLFTYREATEREFLRVGYAGNDGPWQGVEDLMAAAAAFRSEPLLRFRFIGIEKNRFELPEAGSLEIFPRKSQEETARLLTDCDVFVSPRRGRAAETQYPTKLSAYLALGRPIIATDVSDQRAILEAAGCGLLIPPGSPDAIAAAIREILGMPNAQRVDMGRRGRRFAEEHLSLPRFRVALGKVYERLGAGGATPPR